MASGSALGLEPETTGRSTTMSRWIGPAVGTVGLAFVGWTVWREREEVWSVLPGTEPIWLLTALALAFCAMTGIAAAWRLALREMGVAPGLGITLRWYFLGELGKYVPGGIWAVVGRAELAARMGLERWAAYGSVLLSLAATYLAGALVASALVLLGGSTGLSSAQGGLLVGLTLTVVALLHPRIIGWSLSQVERVMGRTLGLPIPSWSSGIRMIAANIPSWLAIGGATWCVARSLGFALPFSELLAAASIAWLVGFLVVPAPGGLGVREATFTLLLSSVAGGVAATIALLARAVFIVADALGAAVFLRMGRDGDSRPVTEERLW